MNRLFGFVGICLLLTAVCRLHAQADEVYINTTMSITEAVLAANAGDVIVLEPGLYQAEHEQYPIHIDQPLTIRARETGKAVIEGIPFQAMFQVNAPGVTIQGLDMRLYRSGIVIHADDVNVSENRFTMADEKYRVSSCGVWIAGAYNATIFNNAFTGCSLCMAGPPISESSKGKVVLTGLFEAGDDTAYFTSHTVVGNTVNGKPLYFFANQDSVHVPRDAGQVIAACCGDVRLDGLDVSDASIGAIIVHCDTVQMVDVKADRGGVFGVYLAFIGGGSLQNVTSNGSNHGIDIRSANNLLVQNCITEQCEQGIFLSWVKNSLLVDCVMTDGGRGLFMAVGQNNQIANCVMQNNENGICTEGDTGVLITNCTVSGNTVAGIRLLRGEATCLSNNISDNRTGMIVSDTVSLTVSGNRFADNQSCGLYLRNLSSAKIVMNQFEGETDSFMTMDTEPSGILLALNALP